MFGWLFNKKPKPAETKQASAKPERVVKTATPPNSQLQDYIQQAQQITEDDAKVVADVVKGWLKQDR